MSNISIFNFESSKEVRTAIHEDGSIWFCLPDVANVLEISRSSDLLQVAKPAFVKNETHKNRGTLDPKGVVKLSTPTKGGSQQVTFVNEPNLYRVIFRSNKDEAVKFQNWVFDEVLPTIRKTGQYRHTISVEQQAQIRHAIAKRCKSNREHYQSVYTALHQEFNVPRYSELLAVDFERAMAFIEKFCQCNFNFVLNCTSDSLFQNSMAQAQLNDIISLLQPMVGYVGELQRRLKQQEQLLRASQKMLK